MSFAANSPNQVTGARRLNLTMLTARDHADEFVGGAPGSAKPLQFLTTFQEAEPYLGLPAHAYKLVSWLVKQTRPCDWEKGSRPIAWPSARLQQEYLGLSATRVKMLNRALFEAGVFVIRDNEQGKRYGRRGPDGRIIEAYGFDLSPLAQRQHEFVRIASEARIERDRMKALRKRATIARRGIRQVGEALAALGPLPPDWSRLEAETADLIAAGRGAGRSEDLGLVVKSLESRKDQAEQWLRDTKPVETNPSPSENRPLITDTNQAFYPKDTVMASNESGRGEASSPSPTPVPAARQEAPKSLKVTPGELADLVPRLGDYLPPGQVSWPAVVDAAALLSGDLGISRYLWGEACLNMGRERAAVALAIVASKGTGHFSRSAGGYFGGMVKKDKRGELHLDRSLWALREAKWGKANRRSVN